MTTVGHSGTPPLPQGGTDLTFELQHYQKRRVMEKETGRKAYGPEKALGE
jgi:hypothetical protein